MAKLACNFLILRLKLKAASIPPAATSLANDSFVRCYLLTRSSYEIKGGLSGGIIGAKSFSSSNSLSTNHPKPKDRGGAVADNDRHVRQEGVFRFDTSETESMGSSSSSSRGSSKYNYEAKKDHDHGQRFINDRNMGGGGDAKEGTEKAMETGLKAAEMAKETMDILWDTSVGTAHNIKDAVAEDDDMEKKRSKGYNNHGGR